MAPGLAPPAAVAREVAKGLEPRERRARDGTEVGVRRAEGLRRRGGPEPWPNRPAPAGRRTRAGAAEAAGGGAGRGGPHPRGVVPCRGGVGWIMATGDERWAGLSRGAGARGVGRRGRGGGRHGFVEGARALARRFGVSPRRCGSGGGGPGRRAGRMGRTSRDATLGRHPDAHGEPQSRPSRTPAATPDGPGPRRPPPPARPPARPPAKPAPRTPTPLPSRCLGGEGQVGDAERESRGMECQARLGAEDESHELAARAAMVENLAPPQVHDHQWATEGGAK